MKRTVAPRVKRNQEPTNAKVKRGNPPRQGPPPDFREDLLKPTGPPKGQTLPNLETLRHIRQIREETVAIKRLALEERDYDREMGKGEAPDWCDRLGWTYAKPLKEGLYLTRWDEKCPVRAVKVTNEPGFLAVKAESIGIWPVAEAVGIWLGPLPWPDGKPELPA